MSIYSSYTYIIGWQFHNKRYYGVRMANKCSPEEDLWVNYYTSSNIVKLFREEHGEPDIIVIDKTFDSREEASKYESNFLKHNDCVYSDEWLNAANWPIIDNRSEKNGMYGKTHSEKTRQKMSAIHKGKTPWNKGKKGIYSEETLQKISTARTGTKTSPETLQKLSIISKERFKENENVTCPHCNKTGQKLAMQQWHFDYCSEYTGKKKQYNKVTCPHCNKTGGGPNMSRWHFDNCKFKMNEKIE